MKEIYLTGFVAKNGISIKVFVDENIDKRMIKFSEIFEAIKEYREWEEERMNNYYDMEEDKCLKR